MREKQMNDPVAISKKQLDMIQQFEADYNAIDHFLRKALCIDKMTSVRYLLDEYTRKHPGWRDAEGLRTLAEVRNAIVHGKTEPYRYVAIPTPAIVQEMKRCRGRLMEPLRAIPTFQCRVAKLSTKDNLTSVMKMIKAHDFSQFPVYQEHCFAGLLTENGITRWLATHVVKKLSLVELDDVSVEEVLENEEKRINYRFASRDMPVDDIKGLFSTMEMIEAVLITASGKESERLLGIATRWDIIHLK